MKTNKVTLVGFPEIGRPLTLPKEEWHFFAALKSQAEILQEADYIAGFLKQANISFCTNSELLFSALRLKVAQGEILPEQVEILFLIQDEFGVTETKVTINQYGVLYNWPTGCFDGTVKILAEIMRTSLK